MTSPDAAAGARLSGLDRQHRTARFYDRVDSDAVRRASQAADALERAILAGDEDAIEAARSSLRSAENALYRQRGRQK